jgi:CBS domain-containing protein
MPVMFDFDVLKISDVQSNDEGRDVFGFNMVRLDALVTDIPRGPALTLSPETSIATAIDSMRRRLRGSAVVIQTHRPLGVVCDRDILAQACGDIDDLRAVPVSAVMVPCIDPLREDDSVGTALRKMCGHRQWHMPIVCRRGLFLGALDIADLSLWLRDRLTLMSVEAALTP